MRFAYFAIHVVVAVSYRLFLFANTSRTSFDTEVLVRKAVSGFLYDLLYILASLVVLELILFFFRSKKVYVFFSTLFLSLVTAMNVGNIYAAGYIPDGIASWSMIEAYAKNFHVLAQTGSGLLSFLPCLLFLTYIAAYLIYARKANLSFQFPAKLFVISLLVGVGANQMAKEVRVNKYGLLEDNSLIRMFKKGKSKSSLSSMISLKKEKIPRRFTEKLDRKDVDYISEKYPFVKMNTEVKRFDYFSEKPNVVLLVLESIGHQDIFENLEEKNHSLTPFLQKLAKRSHNFTQFYSHSGYTAAAQVSLLCSIYDNIRADDPTLSVMRDLYGINLHCLPEILKKEGYQRYFFNGYHASYDNKSFFLPQIGIDEIFCRERLYNIIESSRKDFLWGVRDDRVLAQMRKELNQSSKPFFSTFMSVNSHPPYDMKIEDYDPLGETPREKAVNTTDFQLKKFFESIKNEQWYENTIFIVTSDNGRVSSEEREKLSEKEYFAKLNHVPFFIFHPGGDLPQKNDDRLAGQVDFAPTVLHLISEKLLERPNHLVGESLYKKKRRDFVYTYRYHSRHAFILDGGIYDPVADQFINTEKRSQKFVKKLKAIRKVSAQAIFNDLVWPESQSFFEKMGERYSIIPYRDHYCCEDF